MARRLTRRHLKTAHPVVGIVLRENRAYVLPGSRRWSKERVTNKDKLHQNPNACGHPRKAAGAARDWLLDVVSGARDLRAQSKPQAGYDISGVLNRIEVTPLAAHEIENGPNWSRFPSLLAAASTAIAEPW